MRKRLRRNWRGRETALPAPGKNSHQDPSEQTTIARARWSEQIAAGAAVAMFLTAGGAALVSYWQWGVAEEQLEFAKQLASETSADTQEALNISSRLAIAAERQAEATRAALGISDRVAQATESQAVTSREAISTQFAGQLDIAADLKPIGVPPNNSLEVEFRIKNVGATILKDVEIRLRAALINPMFRQRVVENIEYRRIVTIAPGATVTLSPEGQPMGEDEFGMLNTEQSEIFAAAIVTYRHPLTAGTEERRECWIWGAFLRPKACSLTARY